MDTKWFELGKYWGEKAAHSWRRQGYRGWSGVTGVPEDIRILLEGLWATHLGTVLDYYPALRLADNLEAYRVGFWEGAGPEVRDLIERMTGSLDLSGFDVEDFLERLGL